MKITKHMQSCFLVESENTKILIDPGYFVFENEGLLPSDFKNINAIIITHQHRDHFDWPKIQEIIKVNNGVELFVSAQTKDLISKDSNFDVAILESTKDHIMGSFKISGIPSKHGPLPTGDEPPVVCGVYISDNLTRFYHPGDTVILDKNVKADVIATPICGKVVMNIKEAKEELLALKPKISIPMHYNHPVYQVSVSDFEKEMAGTGIEVKILKDGESVEV